MRVGVESDELILNAQAGAAAMLAETEQSVRQNNFVRRLPEVVAAQVLTLPLQGNLTAAAHLAQTHDLPISVKNGMNCPQIIGIRWLLSVF